MWRDKMQLLVHGMNLFSTPSSSNSSWSRRTTPYWKNLPIHLMMLHVTSLFCQIKVSIKATCFECVEASKRAVTTVLRDNQEESFQRCIEAWHGNLERRIGLVVDYFEGETMQFVFWNLNKLFVIPVPLLFRQTTYNYFKYT